MHNLYFVDSIYTPSGGSESVVSLLPTDPESSEVRTIIVPMNKLFMDNYRGIIQEGWFVFCDEEGHFRYGNTTADARAQFKDYKRLLEATRRNYLGEEHRDDVLFLQSLPDDCGVQVFSYHINVQHGNCSLILLKANGRSEIWMVDCSLSEKGKGDPFAGNLEAGLNAIRKRLGRQDSDPIKTPLLNPSTCRSLFWCEVSC